MFYLYSLRGDLLQVIERQNYEMTALKREMIDIKRLLAQAIVQGQVQNSAHVSLPANEIPPMEPPQGAGTSRTHRHHGKSSKKESPRGEERETGRSTSLPQLDSKRTQVAPGNSSLPGIDIRRKPKKDVVLVSPRQKPGTSGSAC